MADENTMRDYRRRISRIIQHFHAHHPDFALIAVRTLTDAEYNNHFGNTHDLIYTHLRGWYVVDALDQFGRGLVRSTEDLPKFKNAVTWGAQMSGQALPIQVEGDIG